MNKAVAELSWLTGDRTRAIETYQRMLMLNPNDNLGSRYSLSACLLEENTPHARESLRGLLNQFPDDGMSNWAYSHALLLYQVAGHATVQSDHALKRALKANRHVPAYMLGKKRMPRNKPEYMGIGDENEAIEYVWVALRAWAQTPGALEWLRLQSKP